MAMKMANKGVARARNEVHNCHTAPERGQHYDAMEFHMAQPSMQGMPQYAW